MSLHLSSTPRAKAPRSTRAGNPRKTDGVTRAVQTPRRRLAERMSSEELVLDVDRGPLLSAPAEQELANRIVAAEYALIEAIQRLPAGRRELRRLAHQLEHGELGLHAVLLNPDERGLDLESARRSVIATLAGHGGPAAEGRARIDLRILEPILASPPASGDRGVAAARRALGQARDELVVKNLRLVVLFARRFQGRGVPLFDLVQEGNLGLMRAAEKFEPRRGFRFSTYAAWWIKQALQRALLDRTLRIPVHLADDRRRVGRVRAAFAAQHRREPTRGEIASSSGLAPERVDTVLSLPSEPARLDAPVGESEATLGDRVASSVIQPDELVSRAALERRLGGLLGALTEREQQVLKLRFGIGGARESTLEEVGREIGLTRERIRQIERQALEKLRIGAAESDLRSYLD